MIGLKIGSLETVWAKNIVKKRRTCHSSQCSGASRRLTVLLEQLSRMSLPIPPFVQMLQSCSVTSPTRSSMSPYAGQQEPCFSKNPTATRWTWARMTTSVCSTMSIGSTLRTHNARLVLQEDSFLGHKAAHTQKWCKESLEGFWAWTLGLPSSLDLRVWGSIDRYIYIYIYIFSSSSQPNVESLKPPGWTWSLGAEWVGQDHFESWRLMEYRKWWRNVQDPEKDCGRGAVLQHLLLSTVDSSLGFGACVSAHKL